MTEEQKEILIEKMIDSPSCLTNKELDLIMNDQELKDIYEMSSSVSNAYIPQPEVDVREEWESFKPLLRKKPNFMHNFVKVAAIFLGIVVVTSITGVFVNLLVTKNNSEVLVKVEDKKILEDISSEMPVNTIPEKKIEMIPSAESQTNIHQSNREVKTKSVIRDNPQDSDSEEIAIEDYIRIQQARIDNELAMIEAQSIIEEYNELIKLTDSLNLDKSLLQAKINDLTIQ